MPLSCITSVVPSRCFLVRGSEKAFQPGEAPRSEVLREAVEAKRDLAGPLDEFGGRLLRIIDWKDGPRPTMMRGHEMQSEILREWVLGDEPGMVLHPPKRSQFVTILSEHRAPRGAVALGQSTLALTSLTGIGREGLLPSTSSLTLVVQPGGNP